MAAGNGTTTEKLGKLVQMPARRFLSREDVLSAEDIAVQDVHVPEWGGWVRVRTMTGYERDVVETRLQDQREDTASPELRLANMRALYVASSCVDDTGRKLFSVEDVVDLGNKSAAALTRIFRVVMELSSVTEEDVDSAVGKSEETSEGGSTTV